MDNDIIKDVIGTSFKVRTMDGGYRKFTVDDIFGIDETDISKEYIMQASIYGFFAAIMSAAEDIANREEFNKDQEYAACDADARERMERNGLKYTENVIRGMIFQYESYQKAVSRAFKTQYDYKIIKALVRGLEQRAEMLISLGSHLRHESDMTGMTIKDREIDNMSKQVKQSLRNRREPRPAPSEPGQV